MILELTQAVQTYLYKNIIPHYASFYEEMICNRKKHEEEEAKKLHEKNEIEKQKQEHRVAIFFNLLVNFVFLMLQYNFFMPS